MNGLFFSFLILLGLITSASSNYTKDSENETEGINGASTWIGSKSVVPEPGSYVMQPEHPANKLEGCSISSTTTSSLFFQISRPGRSVVVLKTSTPLIIEEQQGLNANLRPGWDGTLGYSLYALEITTKVAGMGFVRLGIRPFPSDSRNFSTSFQKRISRFPDTPASFLNWQKKWRNKLASRLMNGGFPARVPLMAEVLSTEDRLTYTLSLVRYQSQGDRSNTLLLSLPKNRSEQVPLLLALHGHEAKWGETDPGAFTAGHADDFCAYFAERGWAVVQPATMNHTLQHKGWTLQGEWTWDAMVALDYAAALPEIDAKRIAVIGLSTGGHLAMNMLALDQRVKAGIDGCILSTWNHYRERMLIPPHCDCGILGQLGDWLEQCDWAALAAPKPVQFQHGRKDASFCPGADPALLQTGWNIGVMPQEEFAATFAEVKRAYHLSGGSGQENLTIHNDGHHVDSEAAYLFLNNHWINCIFKTDKFQ